MANTDTLVNHFGITVSNLENSMKFYIEIVGMEFFRRGSGSSGDWYETLTETPGAVSKAVMLRSDDLMLQLVEYQQGGLAESYASHNRVGNVHICINVADVEAKYALIKEIGEYRHTEIVRLPDGGLRVPGMRSFYVHDPDGVPVEFVQYGQPQA
jgi:catechol 2,3-dioxygenase-like lactoylglutathione lyase family enzyme